jgi:HTH-type transcriptional regulator / antitoxin HigA
MDWYALGVQQIGCKERSMLNNEPKLIKNEVDYLDAIALYDKLDELDEPTSAEGDRLELLAFLIEEYENKVYHLPDPDPIEAIKFRMEQMNLKQKNLVAYLGNKSKVSAILNRKRDLTLPMVRALHKGLSIPLASLVVGRQNDLIEEVTDIEWDKFPIQAMYNSNKEIFFPGLNKPLSKIKQDIEYYIRSLYEPYLDIIKAIEHYRRTSRMSTRYDKYAIMAWLGAVCRLAEKENIDSEFTGENVDTAMINLRTLSSMAEGPKLAKEYIQKNMGIILVFLEQLPKTYLDGVTFIGKDSRPVIGMTLRYNRLDNFWFTLFHELGHIYNKDLKKNGEPILDDLDIISITEVEEKADNFANNHLIRDSEIPKEIFVSPVAEDVENLAKEKGISPAIIAGRIRFRSNNYRILNRLLGYREVRRLVLNRD